MVLKDYSKIYTPEVRALISKKTKEAMQRPEVRAKLKRPRNKKINVYKYVKRKFRHLNYDLAYKEQRINLELQLINVRKNARANATPDNIDKLSSVLREINSIRTEHSRMSRNNHQGGCTND